MGSILRKLLLIAVAAFLCPGAWPQQPSPPEAQNSQHKPARRLVKLGVSNFAEITPNLYRGGQPHGTGLQALAQMGITTIIDIRLSGADKERAAAKKLGMDFIALPWHCMFPKDDVFAKFLAYIREHPDKKIFVHCRYGDDRTGMMIAAYRMAVEGWSADDARAEMNKFGFHHFLCSSLVKYEKRFPERLRKDVAFQPAESGK